MRRGNVHAFFFLKHDCIKRQEVQEFQGSQVLTKIQAALVIVLLPLDSI